MTKRERRELATKKQLEKKRASFGKKTITPKTTQKEDLDLLIRSSKRALKQYPNDIILKKSLEQYEFLRSNIK